MTPSSWYFCEQRLEHGSGLRAVLREHVALADVVGALAAGQRRLVERDVADQVERVEVRADLLGERLERQALLLQLFDDRLLALGAVPARQERRRGWRSASAAPSCVKSRRLSVTSLPSSSRYSTRSATIVTGTPST